MGGRDTLVTDRLRIQPRFFLLVLLFLVLRLASILTAVEHVSWHEELYEGAIAKELIEGLKIPFLDFQASPYGVGSLFIGILAVPFFLLWGPHLFALKLVPLIFFSLPTLLILFFFLKRHFSEKAAFWGVFLFIFAPPTFSSVSLIALGSHVASVLFSAAMLFLFYEFLYAVKHRTLFFLLFGAVSGFAFYFIYSTLLTFLVCFVSWFFLERSTFSRRRIFLLFGAVLMGLTPFFVYEMSHSWKGTHFLMGIFSPLSRLGASFPRSLLKGLRNVIPLLTAKIPFSFCPRFGGLGQALSYAYCGVFLGILVPFFWKEFRKRRKILPLVLYPLFFVITYAGSRFGGFSSLPSSGFFVSRYFLPLHFFIFLLAAIALGVEKRRHFKIALLVLGIVSQSLLLFKEDFGRAFLYKGYSYYLLGAYGYRSLKLAPNQPNNIWQILEKYPEEARRQLFRGFVRWYTWSNREKENIQDILKWIKIFPPPYRYYYLESLGSVLGFQRDVITRRLLNPLLEACTQEERLYVYQRLSFRSKDKKLVWSRNSKSGILNYTIQWLPVYEKGPQGTGIPRRKRIYREWGEAFGNVWVLGQCSFNEAIESVPRELLKISSEFPEDFYWGVGWGLRRFIFEDRIRLMDWVKQIPPEERGYAREGLQAYERWYGLTTTAI